MTTTNTSGRYDRLVDLVGNHARHLTSGLTAGIDRATVDDRFIDKHVRAFLKYIHTVLADQRRGLGSLRDEQRNCELRLKGLRDELVVAKANVESDLRMRGLAQRIEAAERAVRDAGALVESRSRVVAELEAAIDACPTTEWEHRISMMRGGDPHDRQSRVLAVDGDVLCLANGERLSIARVAGAASEARAS